MQNTIERLDNTAMHLLTEHATLGRVIRHCRERQEEVMARLKHVEELLAKERDLKGDRHQVATQPSPGNRTVRKRTQWPFPLDGAAT